MTDGNQETSIGYAIRISLCIKGDAMLTVANPVDDTELFLLRLALDAEGISYLVVGENYGSLYPGVQVAALNERPIRVSPEDFERAAQVVRDVRSGYTPAGSDLKWGAKLRIVIEGLLFAWFIPGNRRKDVRRDESESTNEEPGAD